MTPPPSAARPPRSASAPDGAAPAPSEEAAPARGLVRGDEAGPATVYRRWSPLVHTPARRALDDAGEAEDVTQRVFIGVRPGRRGHRTERGPIAGRISGVTRREIADAPSARTRRGALAACAGLRPVPGRAGDGRCTDAARDRLLVRDALAGLPEAPQRVLRPAFHEDPARTQIARRAGRPLGTVNCRERRGLRRLHRSLREDAGT
ncbi:ECF subfamily RNA polymerase sigma factor [Streptomyces zinciresistens K42]|uniref:ECF subfamily RNA polymerase sigma factor n=1 Tax=Streptomyces zinciresistens K42 TaxID=700597 RepID=G2GHX9_9ACTN|nr:ECF subfamily RNA polymerase sigma factor [Streptomyces zinciresistens]EGX56902.1 ECF subfamily RNA polymerase sigma factor [Streptomyces zinciresistens K42]